MAALRGHSAAVDMLLTVPGADRLQAHDTRGWTALHMAAACGRSEQVGALLAAAPHAAQDTVGEGGEATALHLAAVCGRTAAFQALLAADPGGAAAEERLCESLCLAAGGGTKQWQSWCSQQRQVQPHTQMPPATCQSTGLLRAATLPWCSCC